MAITEKQSHAYDIRDTFFNALKADAFFAGWTTRPTRLFAVQGDQLPYLGVYISNERMTPDGDFNVGCIRFCHHIKIAFSVIVTDNDPVIAEQTADQAYMQVLKDIYCDLHIWNVLHNMNAENQGIEGPLEGIRRVNHSNAGHNNETPYCEIQYEITVMVRTEWYPDIKDTLDTVDIKTGLLLEEVQTDRDKRQQVEVYIANLDQ